MALIARYYLDGARSGTEYSTSGPGALPPVIHKSLATPCDGPKDQAGTRFPGGGVNSRSSIANPTGNPFSITTTGQLSLSFLLRIDQATFTGEGSTTDYCYPIEKQSEWALRLYSMHSADRAGQLSCYAFNNTGGFGAGARWAASLAAGTWHLINPVYDLLNRTINLYVNGVAAGSGERNFIYHEGLGDEVKVWPAGATNSIVMGGRTVDFIGAIADLRVYNHALTTGEIATLVAEFA